MKKSLYEVLKQTIEMPDDVKKADKTLGELAGTSFWKVLKTQVLEPKIKALLTQTEDIEKVMTGEIDVEQFGIKTLVCRIAAGHLQDIIDKVEQTAEWLEEENQRKEAEKK